MVPLDFWSPKMYMCTFWSHCRFLPNWHHIPSTSPIQQLLNASDLLGLTWPLESPWPPPLSSTQTPKNFLKVQTYSAPPHSYTVPLTSPSSPFTVRPPISSHCHESSSKAQICVPALKLFYGRPWYRMRSKLLAMVYKAYHQVALPASPILFPTTRPYIAVITNFNFLNSSFHLYSV